MRASTPTSSSSTGEGATVRRHDAGERLQHRPLSELYHQQLASFLQASYDINPIFTLSGGVRYQYTENKIDDFVGYNQQQAIATGAATSADAIPGGKTDYNNALFNAGLLAHLTDRQQTGSISLRASRSRTRASITATAPTR